MSGTRTVFVAAQDEATPPGCTLIDIRLDRAHGRIEVVYADEGLPDGEHVVESVGEPEAETDTDAEAEAEIVSEGETNEPGGDQGTTDKPAS